MKPVCHCYCTAYYTSDQKWYISFISILFIFWILYLAKYIFGKIILDQVVLGHGGIYQKQEILSVMNFSWFIGDG